MTVTLDIKTITNSVLSVNPLLNLYKDGKRYITNTNQKKAAGAAILTRSKWI